MPLSLLVQAAIYVGATILGNVLRERPPKPKQQQADPFRLPTIDPSRPIPVVRGLIYISDPAVLWYGRVVKTRLLGHNNNDFDVWSVAVHLGLCLGPVDAAPEIFWDGKPLTDYTQNPGGVGTNSWGISAQRWDKLMPSELLANPFFLDSYKATQKDGYTFYAGSQDQVADAFLIYEGFTAAPAYHGLCNMILWRVFLGPSSVGAPSMQRLSIGLAARPNPLGITPGHETIGVGHNPIVTIFEVLTDAIWACGLPSTVVDVPGFRATAETIYNEGFGIGLYLAEQREAGDVIDEICAHINAVVFPDPETAMVKIKLIRNDYVTANLPLFDDSNAQGIELSRLGWHETKNIVRVKYAGAPGIAVVNGSTRVAVETNLANAQIVGGLNSQDVDYPLIQDPAVAQAVAARDLRAMSYPLARVELEPDRTAYTLRPGDAFRVSSVIKNIPETVCRVGRLGLGRLEEGRMRIGAVEDVFSAGWTGVDPFGTASARVAFIRNDGSNIFKVNLDSFGPDGSEQFQAGGVQIQSAGGDTNGFTPSVIDDMAGGCIVVWQDNRTGTYKVYAQRFGPAATGYNNYDILWAAGGVPLCSAAGAQSGVRACSDGAGGAIVTWEDARTGTNDIYGQRISAAGAVLWTASGAAICTATAAQAQLSIASEDGYGGAVVAWQDARSGSTQEIYAQRIDANGVSLWTANGVQITNVANNQALPKIISDGAGGAFLTWNDPRAGTFSVDIYMQRLNAAGVQQWGANGIVLCNAADNQSLTTEIPNSMIADGFGGFITAWNDARAGATGFYVQRVDANGNALWTANGVLLGTRDTAKYPCLVSDGAGGVMAFWGASNQGVLMQRINAAGFKLWGASASSIGVAPPGVVGIRAASNGSGGALVFWYKLNAGSNGSHLYGQSISASGKELWTAGGVKLIDTIQNSSTQSNNLAVLSTAAAAVPTGPGPTIHEASAVLTISVTVSAVPAAVTLSAKAAIAVSATVAAIADGTHAAKAAIAVSATVAAAAAQTHAAKAAIATAVAATGVGTVTAVPIARLTVSATVTAVGTVV